MPVAPVVAIVISVRTSLGHNVGVADGAAAVLSPVTVIVPVSYTHLTLPTKA